MRIAVVLEKCDKRNSKKIVKGTQCYQWGEKKRTEQKPQDLMIRRKYLWCKGKNRQLLRKNGEKVRVRIINYFGSLICD